MDNKIKFCHDCNNEVEVGLENTILLGEVKGDKYEYQGIEPCTECGHFIPDDEIDKHNLKLLHDTYREQNEIISLEKIQELPIKYDIGKRPLSHLLEWGELTFTRYCNGDIPSKSYSQILIEIYNNPAKYLSLLEENQKFITKKTYEKSKIATENLLQNSSKIYHVLDYILIKSEDITPLAVQKLLYYTGGFYYAFFDEILFAETPIATENGVVYLNILNLLNNNYQINNDIDLTIKEKILIDNIIKYIGCYSGRVLTEFTTKEMPYLSAIDSNKNIEIQNIFDYFKLIKNKCNMLNINDINLYIQDIFRNEN